MQVIKSLKYINHFITYDLVVPLLSMTAVVPVIERLQRMDYIEKVQQRKGLMLAGAALFSKRVPVRNKKNGRASKKSAPTQNRSKARCCCEIRKVLRSIIIFNYLLSKLSN